MKIPRILLTSVLGNPNKVRTKGFYLLCVPHTESEFYSWYLSSGGFLQRDLNLLRSNKVKTKGFYLSWVPYTILVGSPSVPLLNTLRILWLLGLSPDNSVSGTAVWRPILHFSPNYKTTFSRWHLSMSVSLVSGFYSLYWSSEFFFTKGSPSTLLILVIGLYMISLDTQNQRQR